MTKIEADRAVVRNIPQSRRIEISLWSHGTEMKRDMSEDEALRIAADIIQAIGANKEAAGGQ
jgi:hypothetical protein